MYVCFFCSSAHTHFFLATLPLPILCPPAVKGLDDLEEDATPAYGQPASLPVEPSLVPESTGPTGVDEFGLPVAPTPAEPTAQRV